MQTMPFPKITAFVEGSMERFFINTNFDYVDVVPVTNGKHIPSKTLAKNIASLYRSKDPNSDYIVIWVDREGRPDTSEQIRQHIHEEMIISGANPDILIIGVPDMMTENWILSDEKVIRDVTNNENYTYSYESKNGKHILSEIYKSLGKNYKEMKDGVLLLKRLRLPRASENSASAKSFFDSISINCWWLEV